MRIAKLLLPALCLATHACAALSAGGNDADKPPPGFNEETFEGLAWRNVGPAKMSGRIADIVIHPENRHLWYVAVGSGGVWKTVNAGTSWEPVFDEEGSYSIGALALDPDDPKVIWAGSGENVSGRHVGYGDGVYKSRDGGKNWEHMGLAESEHIGMIRIDPRDSEVIYVAAQGPLWSGGGQRGLYQSSDGGANWEKILGEGKYTGVSEVHFAPDDPDTLYAVTWQRLRNVAVLMDGGPGSGIHKSTDGGKTWRELTEGLPEETMGKIGLAISPQDPDVIYATIEMARRSGGFWRSADGGETWEKRSEFAATGTGPHYYNEIFASPHHFDRVYHMDVRLHATADGGENFERMEALNKHVDHHAMAFVPEDPQYLLVGTDGGLYQSFDDGGTWRFVGNLPVTQFYKVAVDYDTPFYNIYGGTQDNNTQGGPSRTDNVHGIRNSDWNIVLWGDGHEPEVDPTNPNIIYAQWQRGNLTRYDRATGESVYIQPQPGPDEPAERFNWDAPVLISPHDPARLYVASQRLWRSDDRGDSWMALSGDLTRGIDRLLEPVMGRQWSWDSPWDLYAMSVYGSVTAIDESPLVEGLLYVGTDDGLVRVSEDGGESWRTVDSLPGVADGYYVNDLEADLHDADTVYLAVDQHKRGDLAPHLYVSRNRGRSWKRIDRDLPERHVVWRIVQDHVEPGLLFAATEFGVFFTVDSGKRWTKLAGGVPNIAFRDLVIQRRENDLVGASFGRGFYVLDDYSVLREVSQAQLESEVRLFDVREAPWYVPRRPLGCGTDGCKASQGDAYYVAPNPPFGAVFTYYLPETLRSLEEQRRHAEKPREKKGEDTPFPGWERVLEEQREDAPGIVLTVRDDQGRIMRHVEGPVEAGFHRVAWDLRYPLLDPWLPEAEREPFQYEPASLLAEPGRYSVSLARRVDGELEPVGQPRTFELRSIREPTLAGSPQDERVTFHRRVDELKRAVDGAVKAVDELQIQTAAIKESLARSTADPGLYARTQRLEQRARILRDRLTENDARKFMGDSGPVPIDRRLQVAGLAARWNAYGPTQTQRDSLAIAEKAFGETGRALDRLLDEDYAALKGDLDAAGVPWTPGRGVPVGN